MTYRDPSARDELLVIGFGAHVVAVHVDTGQRVWGYDLFGGNVRIAVEDDRVYALGSELVCLEYATGKLVWRQPELPMGSRMNWTLLVHGGSIVVGSNGEAACFDRASGKLLWHEEFKGMGAAHVALGFPGKNVQGDLDG
jgi:outer membrane protein assembly factor BamB